MLAQRTLTQTFDAWCEYLRSWEGVERAYHGYDVRRVRWRVRIDIVNDHHVERVLDEHELGMGGEGALRQWMRIVEDHVRHQVEIALAQAVYGGLHRYVIANISTGMEGVAQWDRTRVDTLYGWTAIRPFMGVDFAQNPEADKKAKDLFRAVAGQEAFDRLDTHGSLPITGSKGTAYVLHRRATFCIERPSDGAQLCVVVPGVPLWDHLLGVKLMVEHDEPKFLRTANVVPGPRTVTRPARDCASYRLGDIVDQAMRVIMGRTP